MFEYKVFVRNGVEHFGYRQEAGRAKNASFALGQSLLDFLDVDMDKFMKPFAQMGERPDMSFFEQELQKLAREHIYFQFVRLDWLDRLDAHRQEKEEWEALLSSKELSRFPIRVITLQNQVKRLIAGALNISHKVQRNHTMLLCVKEYYYEPGEKFSFGTIATEFSCAGGIYGDVLVARKLEDIPSYLLREFIKQNCCYKTCLHCGKYFAPDHGNAEYCVRPVADSEKTCRDIGASCVMVTL